MHPGAGTVPGGPSRRWSARQLASLLAAAVLAVLTLLALLAAVLAAPSRASAQSTAKQPKAYALIDVTVASLWAKPTDPRRIDAPALSNPVRLGAWLNPLTTAQRVWLTGRLDDQGLYGQQVAIWKERGSWDKISLAGQATRTGLSYPGWVPARQLTTPTPATPGSPPSSPSAGAGSPSSEQAVITAPKAWLYQETSPGQPGRRLLDLSFNTRLPELGQIGAWTIVQTPNGESALLKSSAIVTRDPTTAVPPPTGRQLVRLARRFLGLPYLWAGTSAYGFDCSGFTYTLYDFYGIVLPRTSELQAKTGHKVRLDALKPGDLVFFATDPPAKDVSHVAMYVGGGDIIQSPHSGAAVQIIPLSRLLPYYVGARRYLPPQAAPQS